MNQKAFVIIFKGLSLKCENPTLSNYVVLFLFASAIQKQPSKGVLRCPKNMQQMYRETPMPNIFRMPFPKNTSGCF